MSRADDARTLLAIPLLGELFAEQESAAINKAVSAKYDDHEARQAAMADVRAVRSLRSMLEVISKEDQPSERKKAPA